MKSALALLAVLALLVILTPGHICAWSNGAVVDFCGQPFAYVEEGESGPERGTMGTHDFLAESALNWVKSTVVDPYVWSWLDGNRFYYYLGTEAPDIAKVQNCIGMTPAEQDEWGDTTYHHIYLQQDGRPCSGEDDAADRAQECLDAATAALEDCQYARAAFYFGAMTHYVADMSMFAHVLDDTACYRTYTNQEEDPCHAPLEDWVDDLIQDTQGTAFTLMFDGEFRVWDAVKPAYYAALENARITDQGNFADIDPQRRGYTRDCAWMMEHCRDYYDPDFFMSLQDSLSRAANYIADLIPAAWNLAQTVHGCPEISIQIQESYQSGDPFHLELRHNHQGTQQVDADIYVLLDIHGAFFWYPVWDALPRPSRCTLFPGVWTQQILSISALPAPLPAGGPFYLYAASLQAGSASAIYDWDSRSFIFR